jgi:mannose-1-phosphate guanylyltransferase
MNKNNYVAIMAGGIGSRFWPMSRTSHPKQFLDILNTGRTLIQATYDRFKKFIPEENIYVVTSEQYHDMVQKQLPELKEGNILSEPSREKYGTLYSLYCLQIATTKSECKFNLCTRRSFDF